MVSKIKVNQKTRSNSRTGMKRANPNLLWEPWGLLLFVAKTKPN